MFLQSIFIWIFHFQCILSCVSMLRQEKILAVQIVLPLVEDFHDSIRKNNWEWERRYRYHINGHLPWTACKSNLTRPAGHLGMFLASAGSQGRLRRPPEKIQRLHTLQTDKQSCHAIGCGSVWLSEFRRVESGWVFNGCGFAPSGGWFCSHVTDNPWNLLASYNQMEQN